MTEQIIRDLHDDDAAPLLGPQVPVMCFEKLPPFAAPVDLVDEGMGSDSARSRGSTFAASALR